MMDKPRSSKPRAIVIGAGPAGLMAAERLVHADLQVEVYDAMPSAGRKFLLAGKGGMNLTHAEEFPQFQQRYFNRQQNLERALHGFTPQHIREWASILGIETFIGSSGRVFPVDMKAAPLLRAWLHRLREAGVRFHMRHKWLGFRENGHHFQTADGEIDVHAEIVIFAMGGASWPRLGSDAKWCWQFQQQGLQLKEFVPSNCGFNLEWSAHFKQKFAGSPLKKVGISLTDTQGKVQSRTGQFVISETGIEGSLVYAMSSYIRDLILRDGSATVYLDLLPDKDEGRVLRELAIPRGARSLSSHLRSKLGLHPVHNGLIQESLPKGVIQDLPSLATAIKNLPLKIISPRPIDEAISSAGGVSFESLNEDLMLKKFPGIFCAGEMLDWEAPTGGYLLSACFATGYLAGEGAVRYAKSLGKLATL